MSLNDRIREKLALMITNLGGTVPTVPSPTDEENRTLALLDELATQLSGAASKLVVFRARTTAECVPQWFFIADRSYRITRIDYVHSTAESTASELYSAVAIASGTTAPGSATSAHTLVFDCKTVAANTVQTRSSAQIDNPVVAAGSRLTPRFISGTPTELAGVCITVTLVPV